MTILRAWFFIVVVLSVFTYSTALCASSKDEMRYSSLKAELDAYVESQWKQHGTAWLPKSKKKHRIGLAANAKTSAQVIVFYVHGFAPIKCGPEQSAFFFHPFEDVFRGIKYSLCCPGLDCRRKYMSFAQGLDVYQVEKHLERLLEERAKAFPDIPIVCVAHSNGASTLISLLCKNSRLRKDIKGVVLLAPYAAVSKTSFFKIASRLRGGMSLLHNLMMLFVAPNHDKTFPAPVDLVTQGHYSDSLPTLLVHSKDDPIVPYENFELLQNAFQRKNKNIKFLSLTSDSHFFMRSSGELKDGIRAFVDGVLAKPAIA